MSRATIETLITQIENETSASGNSKKRIANLLRQINNEKFDSSDTMNKSDILTLVNSNSQFKSVIDSSTTFDDGVPAWGFAGEGIYPNADNETISAGKIGIITYDGHVFSSLEIDLPSNSSEGVTIPFSTVISFNNNLAISTKTVNSAITFSALGDYAIIGGSTLVKLTADGANVPDFSNFKKMSGSQSYVNTAGVVNNCYFFYDGVDAWLNIWQGTGSSNIIYNDVTPPTAPTLTYSNETNTTVDLAWSGATDNVGVTSYEIYKDDVLIDTVSASPLTVTGLTASTNYDFKVKAKDASGNISAFSNAVSITTTNTPTFLSVVFDELYGAAYSSGLLSGNNLTGGYQSTAQTINDGFFLYMTDFAFTSVLGITNAKGSNMSYGTDTTYVYAFYRTNVGVDLVKGAGRTLIHSSSSGVPNYVKLERVGNNAVFSTSSDGTNWTVLFTDVNGFSGVSTGYIKGVFANNAGTIRAFKNP